MSAPLRPGASGWRRAASVVLAAGGARPDDAGFQLLLLRRAPGQAFLPDAHVFPGGVVDAADRSPEWRRLFAPQHGPPRFGLGPAPRRPPRVAPAPAAGDPAALPDDVAARICAVREAFEEAGVLLLRPRGAPPAAAPGRAFPPPPGLAAWRAHVRSDSRHFLSLCARLDCAPDIWALQPWSAWLTPYSPGRRRFDTAFFLCCLSEPPSVDPDGLEVTSHQWLSPSEAIESFIRKEILLAPPQFYEVRRLENFASLSALHQFSVDRALEGADRCPAISFLTADGMLQLLPGDELYVEGSHTSEKILSTDKTTEEVMKAGKKFHRIVMYNKHLYHILINVQPESNHIYPKSYVGGQSHL